MSGLSSHGAGAAGTAVELIVNATNAAAAARSFSLGIVILFSSLRKVCRTNSEHEYPRISLAGASRHPVATGGHSLRFSVLPGTTIFHLWARDHLARNILKGRFG